VDAATSSPDAQFRNPLPAAARRILPALLSVAACVAACRSASGPPELSGDERALVDAYVRVAVLDAWRADEPDTVHAILDRMAATQDTVAVGRALARLEREPLRWEGVWETIAARLHSLESEPTPRIAWRELTGEPVPPPPPGEPPDPHGARPRAPAPDSVQR